MSGRRRIVASIVLIVAGAIVSMGPPRLTLTNAGLSVEYPWFRGIGALVAALGAGLLAVALRRRWPRIAAGLLAALGLGVGAHLLAYRLEGPDETRIEVDTTDFRPEQRASLERTIARRIHDSAPR